MGKTRTCRSKKLFKKNVNGKGEALVSIAGPIMNFIMAFIFALIYCAVYKFGSMTFLSSTLGSTTLLVLSGVISINIGLGVFNLIPLPPLDGSKVILPFLPQKAKKLVL